jgi:hypothetical protein
MYFTRTPYCIILVHKGGGIYQMSLALEERTTGHASYTNIERILQIIEEIDSSERLANEILLLERINGTFLLLKEAIDRVDPWLVSISTLNNMNTHISYVLSEVTNYIGNRNVHHLNQALAHVENVLPFFSQVLVTKSPDEVEGLKTSVTRFRQSVGQYITNVEREAEETSEVLKKNQDKLTDLTTSIEAQKGRIDTIISDFQKQFLDNQTQRSESFSDFKTALELEFNDGMKTYAEDFEQFLTDQQETNDVQKESFQDQFNTQQTIFNELIENFKGKVQTEYDQINAMNKEAEKIVGIISMKGLAHGYQKIANDEGNKAFWWNLGSIASVIGVISFGVVFLLIHEGTFDWPTLISRVVLTGVGLTLFTYCAKQAGNHRNEERRNRKIELELASLDPYLKDMEPAEQKVVKQKLVDKYFGVELQANNTPTQQTSQQNVVDTLGSNHQLMQSLAERVSQLISQK